MYPVPNYLGEFIEWLGWAIMTFSTAGFVFFFLDSSLIYYQELLLTTKWYKDNFEDYPKDRKAVIPKLL
jgi:steroid 5-alpha reductase family enzyme